MTIPLKSAQEIKGIAAAGKILAKILRIISREAKVGAKLSDLNKLAYRLTKQEKAQPAFLGYKPDAASKPFGASICASVNEVVVHGFPSDYKLISGDVLKIDFGVEHQGFFADAALTIAVGKVSKETEYLIKTTKMALAKAIKIAKAGNTLGDIGWIISKTAEKSGFKIIKDLTGHGIGLKLHEEPTIYNFGEKGKGIELKPGMVLAIEPMFSISTDKITQKPDESWATADSSLSAHFEHTIALTEKGAKILTEI